MEKILEKIAKQLLAYDEASLLSLWDKYHDLVKRFEPTKKWEEAALIFGLIQAVRWKNQLFNAKWSSQKTLSPQIHEKMPAEFWNKDQVGDFKEGSSHQEKGKIIQFPSHNDINQDE